MVEGLVKDLEKVNLFDYFHEDAFRTVRDEGMLNRGGISEVRVIVEFRGSTAKKLNFDLHNSNVVYAFAIMNDKIKEINQDAYAEYYRKKGKISRIYLTDCGKQFILTFEMLEGENLVYSVDAKDVIYLLNECTQAPQEVY